MTTDGSQSGPGRPRPGRRTFRGWAAAAVAAALVGAAVFWAAGRGRRPAAPPLAISPPVEDPRVAYAGPFLNVRPEVGYVGDDRCAECHQEIAASYRRHPMARSLTPIARLAQEQSYGADRHNPFETAASRFLVERVGDGVHHRQTRLDEAGRSLYENDQEVRYAIGSGVHGYSYLTDRDGFVFQTPISWFEQKRIWDLSPRFPMQYITGRPVSADCLYCHSNRTRPVAGSINHFEEPLFRGYGIGCERCHGPGERHVRDPGKSPSAPFDATIVNPARLEPSLRNSVCNQCHLEGVARIARRGATRPTSAPACRWASFWRCSSGRPPAARIDARSTTSSRWSRAAAFAAAPRGTALAAFPATTPTSSWRRRSEWPTTGRPV